jgi:hypothetical protein
MEAVAQQTCSNLLLLIISAAPLQGSRLRGELVRVWQEPPSSD